MPLSGASGGGGGAGAIRAGAAYIELFARDKIGGVLDKIGSKMRSFGATIAKAGVGMTAAGGALFAGVAGPLKALTGRGQEVERLSQTLGASAETVTRLGYAFETAGVGFDQFGEKAKDFQAKLADGADQLREFGLDATAVAAMPLQDQFAAIADHMQRLGRADQFSLAEKLGIKELLPVLQKGSGELDRLAGEADALGYTMSGKTAKESAALGREFDKTWTAIQMAILEVGAALLPQGDQIKDLAGQIRATAATVREWIDRNKEVIQIVAAVAAGLIAAGIAVTALGTAMSIAGTAVAAVGTAVSVLGSLIGALLSPVGLVVAAVAGLGYVFATETDAGKGIVNSLKAGFADLAGTAKQTWGGVSAAMRKGDLGLAADIAFQGLKVAWLKVEKWLVNIWNVFKSTFVDTWRNAVAGVKLIFHDLMAWLARNTIGALRGLLDNIRRALDAVMGANKTSAMLQGAIDLIPSDAKINAVRDNTKKEIVDERVKKQAADEKIRKADSAKAQKAIDAAQAELDRLTAKANEAREAAAAAPGAVGKGGPRMPDLPRFADAVKGAFTTPRAAEQFGVGNKTVEMRQLDAVNKVASNTGELPEIRQGISNLAASLAFG